MKSLLVALALSAPALALSTEIPMLLDKAAVTPAPAATVPAPDAARDTPAAAPSTQITPYGAVLFSGKFSSEQFTGFNPDYLIATGDRIALRMWGALQVEQTVTVDAQGNIFVPRVGPVAVRNVPNARLNATVAAHAGRVFRDNVGVYAALEAAQPVKVFVTGAVRAPGLYAGVSADSILRFLDKAAGVDPQRGSYVDITLMRNGVARERFDLYRFLREAKMPSVQLQDGDVLLVGTRGPSVVVRGEVLNENLFETRGANTALADVLEMARLRPNATHAVVTRRQGAQRHTHVVPLSEIAGVQLGDGDEVLITADKHPGSLVVRLEGEHLGTKTLTLAPGATLAQVLAKLDASTMADTQAVRVYRKSVALKQKEALDLQLANLQQYVLTTRSSTREEGELRKIEAELALRFIERARAVVPRGQIVLPAGTPAQSMLLEDGDVVEIPTRTSVVMVHGEVTFPSAQAWAPSQTVGRYIEQSGGYAKKAERSRVLLLRADGTAQQATDDTPVAAADEIFVLPKVEGKNLEVARGIGELLFRIAFVAKVALGL